MSGFVQNKVICFSCYLHVEKMFIDVNSHAQILQKSHFAEAFDALSGRTLSGRISSGGVSRTTPNIES